MSTVFLIGFPGCGKTTLGVELARVMNCAFIDLDDYIERLAGQSVVNIFADNGEDYFRRLEKKALRDLSTFDGIVACGGGTPCHDDNMELMNSMGTTVWLTTSEERIISRLCLPEHRAKRPQIATLTDEEIATYVHNAVAQRSPYYAQAQLQFDSTDIETAAETSVTARRLAKVLDTNLHQSIPSNNRKLGKK